MKTKFERPAVCIKQGDLTLYATSLKVSDFMEEGFYDIDRLDPEDKKGYQRLLNVSRAKKFANYILDGQDDRDAFLPTSIFMATDKNIKFNPDKNTIEFDIRDIGSFNIVDGQHRIEGLKMAAVKDERVLDFEIPVNIAVNHSEIAQMVHFLIVNTTQKTVDKGIEQRIRARLHGLINTSDIPTLPRWIRNVVAGGEDDQAIKYVDFLNQTEESPWKGKILMPNEDKKEPLLKKNAKINQNSFVDAIKQYILVGDNPLLSKNLSINEDIRHRIFMNYWQAIFDIIGDESNSVLYKYNGVYLFCMFAVPFFSKLITNGKDYRVETMKRILKSTFENVEGDYAGIGHSEFWKPGSIASGLNKGALRKINSELKAAMNTSSTTDNEDKIMI